MAKLRVLSNAECMDLVKDILKNYRLPYPARTIGEKIAEARQQSGAEKLKGHDIMALERFDPEVRHMIVFDVLSTYCHSYGWKRSQSAYIGGRNQYIDSGKKRCGNRSFKNQNTRKTCTDGITDGVERA